MNKHCITSCNSNFSRDSSMHHDEKQGATHTMLGQQHAHLFQCLAAWGQSGQPSQTAACSQTAAAAAAAANLHGCCLCHCCGKDLLLV
jgi:hypothetical protein